MDCFSNELEVKKMVNELTKTVNDVTRSLKSWRNSEPHRCFMCQKIGYISHNYPNKQQVKGETSKEKESEQMIKWTDMHFFEFINNQEHQSVRKGLGDESLVDNNDDELSDEGDIFMVRKLDKVEIEKSGVSNMLERAVNKNKVEIREILLVDDQNLVNKYYKGQVVYWDLDKERDGRTIEELDMTRL
ncbi:1303_t:CDS:2 [Dentiscutata erythropus]|uniref:1303_t:CDS:1 n=1 Tax=Dentiscutata erythropus TaxID=1348616 RepID=A0A9N9AK85_9GLOM|nr:1303_t:CDS:2 [Dentiscutata erythropus]